MEGRQDGDTLSAKRKLRDEVQFLTDPVKNCLPGGRTSVIHLSLETGSMGDGHSRSKHKLRMTTLEEQLSQKGRVTKMVWRDKKKNKDGVGSMRTFQKRTGQQARQVWA